MFELLDQLGHMEEQSALRRKGEELAAKLMEDEKDVSPWPVDFMRFALPAYLRVVQQTSYYFSCEEILWLAECAANNVVVAKGEHGAFCVEGHELGHSGPTAVIFLQGGRRKAFA